MLLTISTTHRANLYREALARLVEEEQLIDREEAVEQVTVGCVLTHPFASSRTEAVVNARQDV